MGVSEHPGRVQANVRVRMIDNLKKLICGARNIPTKQIAHGSASDYVVRAIQVLDMVSNAPFGAMVSRQY
jgi:hypothetical protein